MYGHIYKILKKTNFFAFSFSLLSLNQLNAFPATFPFSSVLLNKFYTEFELKEEKSIGIPIISSTWTAFKEINNVNITDETVSVVADKETYAAQETSLNTITSTPTTTFENLSNTKQRRQYVAWFAESYTEWGFRYLYGGTNIEKGIDCSAFTRFVLNYFDYKTSRTAHEQFQDGIKINVEQARQGDLVFFGPSKEITHVAVVIRNDETGLWVVHSTCTEGIHKENISNSAYWKPKLKKTAVSIIGKE